MHVPGPESSSAPLSSPAACVAQIYLLEPEILRLTLFSGLHTCLEALWKTKKTSKRPQTIPPWAQEQAPNTISNHCHHLSAIIYCFGYLPN